MLGALMANRKNGSPSVLDVVALLEDREADKLGRGQVGTVVEDESGGNFLVEFSDDSGRAYAIATCPASQLIVLHYVPQAA
jgi:membrane protein implicated in regulation of membrane protease activity